MESVSGTTESSLPSLFEDEETALSVPKVGDLGEDVQLVTTETRVQPGSSLLGVWCASFQNSCSSLEDVQKYIERYNFMSFLKSVITFCNLLFLPRKTSLQLFFF